MEENYGGPVWHASTSPPRGFHLPPSYLEQLAREALAGVGDPGLGEWTEWSGRAFHLRRRLTPGEQGELTVIDVRGTPEAAKRLRSVRHILPADFLAAELEAP